MRTCEQVHTFNRRLEAIDTRQRIARDGWLYSLVNGKNMRLIYAYFQHLPNTVKRVHFLNKHLSYTKPDKPCAYFPCLLFPVISFMSKKFIDVSWARHRGQKLCLFPRNLPMRSCESVSTWASTSNFFLYRLGWHYQASASTINGFLQWVILKKPSFGACNRWLLFKGISARMRSFHRYCRIECSDQCAGLAGYAGQSVISEVLPDRVDMAWEVLI